MGEFTKENGKKTRDMAREQNVIPLEISTKASSLRARLTGTDCSLGTTTSPKSQKSLKRRTTANGTME